jgi:hypothetical protein
MGTIMRAVEDMLVHLKATDRHVDRIIECDEREMQFTTLKGRAVTEAWPLNAVYAKFNFVTQSGRYVSCGGTCWSHYDVTVTSRHNNGGRAFKLPNLVWRKCRYLAAEDGNGSGSGSTRTWEHLACTTEKVMSKAEIQI